MQYTAAFKRRMVARMIGPRALTAAALARGRTARSDPPAA